MSRYDLAPLFDLRLATPRLELRLGSTDELVELARLAEEGVHPPDEMPFAIAWTDQIGEPGFMESFLEYHVRQLADWSPDEWAINFLVWEGTSLVGTQELLAVRFAERRTVSTGSWLGQRFQRRGLGTEMRAAALELAFSGLGASSAESAWLEGNDSSRRVSEKLGYKAVGMKEEQPRGEPVPTTIVALEREHWCCPVAVEISGLVPCLPLFSGSP